MKRIDFARQFLTRELDFARVVVLDPDEWDEEYGSSQGWALPYEVVDDECVIPLRRARPSPTFVTPTSPR